MSWSKVIGPVGTRPLTDEDLVWATKMVSHEATNSPLEWQACLWTTLNRWMSGRYTAGNPNQTYTQALQRFSQPINPRQIGVVHSYDRTEADPSGQINAARRWERIREHLANPYSYYLEHYSGQADMVRRFFRGEVPVNGFVGWVDFAAPGFAQEGDIRVTVPGLPDNGNWFFKEPFSLAWKANTIRIVPITGSTLDAALGVGLGILIAGVGIGIWKHRRA